MNDKSNSSRKEITKEKIISDLKNIGIKLGDTLYVALSYKSLGPVAGGPESVIDALIETIGPNGTLMMNAHIRPYHFSLIKTKNEVQIYDHKSTPTYTGIVPELFRKREGTIRSIHPVISVTAKGKQAKYLTDDHDENSNPYLPYIKLIELGGKMLFIGIGDNLVGIRHLAQQLAGLSTKVPLWYSVKYRDEKGKIKSYFCKDMFGCKTKLPELVPLIRKMGYINDVKVGNANAILAPSKEVLDAMTKILKKSPYLNLCDDVSCYWCRELERRMDLYKQIEKPNFFQKNLLFIKTIALINRLRLKNHILAGKLMIGFIRLQRFFPNQNLKPQDEQVKK